MDSYLFIFGRTPELAWQELVAIFTKSERLDQNTALIKDESDSPEQIISRLGGTYKIARIVGQIDHISADNLLKFLDYSQKQIDFGVSFITENVRSNPQLLPEMKQLLSQNGISARYNIPSHSNQLSSVVINKKSIQELIVVYRAEGFVIARTVAVQPFEEWNKRDYGRPFSDAKSGMLPPKVARMIINMTLGETPKGKTVLDPFCGMGTILAEAMLTGANITGSDISEEIAQKAKKNLDYTAHNNKLTEIPINIFVSDAVNISHKISPESVDAVITEPFMGDPKLGEKKLDFTKAKNIIRGLEKLYIGCLRDWYKIIKINGRVCIAFPKIEINGRRLLVKKVIDTCEKLGYTKLLGPITYGREQAIVLRDFYLFKKN
jgi:tRNA G10  N-methylase Trm11